MAIDYTKLGKRVKAQRAKLKLSQAMLAERCDISDIYISHIETGKAKPSLDVLFSIAEVLGVTLDALLIDSIYCSTERLSDEIAAKLKRCTPENMHLINRMIDVVLESQK